MRIIAGDHRGARLLSPPGDATRPTLARVREAMLMMLEPELPGARMLDLFAGAGALGLEALSRGAQSAVFVEISRGAADALRSNVFKLRLRDRAELVRGDALRFLGAEPSAEPFTLVALDPPYGEGLSHRALVKLGDRAASWLAPGAVIVAQVGKRDALEPAYGPLRRYRERAYGETRLVFYVYEAADADGPVFENVASPPPVDKAQNSSS